MEKVAVNVFDRLGPMAAASLIPFGAAVAYAASGTVKPSIDIGVAQNLLGVADDDDVEKTEPGFYSQYDAVPIVTAGRVRLWVTSNETTKEDILAGDYLEIADVGGTNTLSVGAFQQMDAEGGTPTGAVRQATSVARALESVTLTDIEPVAANVAVGDTTVTMSSGNMTLLDLKADDYILLEDASANCVVNRVASVSATVITLQIASTVALASGTDPVHKLHQVEAMLI